MFGETQRLVPYTAGASGASAKAVEVQIQGETVMENVEHLGKYVHEMTLAKIEHLKASGRQLPTREASMVDADAGAMLKVEEEDEDRPENVLIDGAVGTGVKGEVGMSDEE